MPAKKTSRCWPGYEPVPGKEPNAQGSCRPKAESKSTPSEKQFKARRKKQLANWKKAHPGSRPQAAQHLHSPDAEPSPRKRTAKKTAPKKTAARKSTTKKAAARKRK